MSDLENLIEILNLIGVTDEWYSNDVIAEKLIAHGVKYVPPTMKGGATDNNVGDKTEKGGVR